MKKRRYILIASLVILILASVAPVLTGCISEKSDNRFMDLLALLPASAVEDECFFLIDYEAMWEKNGITFPDSILDKSDIFDILVEHIFSDSHNKDQGILYFSSFYTGWVFIQWQQEGIAPVQTEYVGYDIPNVAVEINNGVKNQFTPAFGSIENLSEPDMKVAAIGNFSPEETSRALENREDWPEWVVDSYWQERYRGVVIHNWIAGSAPPGYQGISPPHNLDGELPAFAVTDGRLYVGESIEDVRQMMDAGAGISSTLADIPEYDLLVDGLSELGSYVAIIGDERLTNADTVAFTDYALNPFLTFGTGYGSDDKGAYVALVLVHESSELANANVDILKKRFSEYQFSFGSSPIVDDMLVWNEGRVLLAKLYTENLDYWYTWLTWETNTLFHTEKE